MVEWTAPCVLDPSKGENFAFEKNLLESILDFFFRSIRTRSPSAPFRSLALDFSPKFFEGFSLRSLIKIEEYILGGLLGVVTIDGVYSIHGTTVGLFWVAATFTWSW